MIQVAVVQLIVEYWAHGTRHPGRIGQGTFTVVQRQAALIVHLARDRSLLEHVLKRARDSVDVYRPVLREQGGADRV